MTCKIHAYFCEMKIPLMGSNTTLTLFQILWIQKNPPISNTFISWHWKTHLRQRGASTPHAEQCKYAYRSSLEQYSSKQWGYKPVTITWLNHTAYLEDFECRVRDFVPALTAESITYLFTVYFSIYSYMWIPITPYCFNAIPHHSLLLLCKCLGALYGDQDTATIDAIHGMKRLISTKNLVQTKSK